MKNDAHSNEDTRKKVKEGRKYMRRQEQEKLQYNSEFPR
jgi:hypothetical protein